MISRARILPAIAVLLLLALGWIGLTNGLQELPDAESAGQIVQSAAQVMYGLFALLSLAATRWAPRWTRRMLAGWVASVTLAAGLAPVVWGDASTLSGVLSGAAGALIALAIAWALQAGSR